MFENKRKVIVHFFITALLLVVYLGVSSYFNQYTEADPVREKLQENIENEIIQVENSITERAATPQGSLKELSSEEPYRDFVYLEDDSVTFYTTNEIVWTDTCLRTKELCVIEIANRFLIVNPISVDNNGRILHLITLKKQYDSPNRFLKNEFVIGENIPSKWNIELEPVKQGVNLKGELRFDIYKKDQVSLADRQARILFLIFFFFLVSVFLLLKTLYEQMKFSRRKRGVKLFGIAIDSFLLLLILIYFQIPGNLFESYLFDGALFVFPGVFTDLGSALFILAATSIVAWSIFMTPFDINVKRQIPAFIHSLIIFGFAVWVLFFPYLLIKNLVLNSTIPLSINQLDELNFSSILAGLTIFLGGLSALLIHLKLLNISYSLNSQKKLFGVLWGIGAAVILYLSFIENILYLFILLQVIITAVGIYLLKGQFNLTFIVIIVVAASVSYSLILGSLNNEKENQQIKVRAISLLNNRDKISEYRYYEQVNKLKEDERVDSLVQRYQNNALVEDELLAYIKENYFRSFHLKYEMNFTLCEKGTQLIIDDEAENVECYSYFSNIKEEYGVGTVSENLFYIDDGDEIRNYLGKLKLGDDLQLYVDIFQKSSPLAQGYPELLESKQSERMLNPEYSYAIYFDGELVNSYGDMNYPINHKADSSMYSEDFVHFEFTDDDASEKLLIISKTRDTYTEILAGATYLIIIFGLLLLLFYFLMEQRINTGYFTKFRSRLQLSIFSILLISFVVIGFFVFSHISKQNNEKNRNNLEELSHSIRIELEHKLAHLDHIDEVSEDYVYDQLIKFSQVFFSDINLFDTNGELIVSSRPRIFDRNIINRRINPEPFYQLRKNELAIFIHKEKIGDYQFLSSYFPLRNYDNEVIAYVNLPYFSKQRQLTEEISAFLTTFINIYIILTIGSLVIIWVISNYITKPMETIKNFLGKTKLQEKNAKIDIERKDEIGDLVKEYNSMVDELEKSARLLAASERETAWREMARQVAHEIKNPLTPMKLSVQQFERSFLQDPENSEEAVKRFTWNIIQQIDSLSEIASAFSDFAKMPKASMKKLDLVESINNTVELFEGEENIEVVTQFDVDRIEIEADEKQIQRVFINLIKNSLQALNQQKAGKIEIHGYTENQKAVVIIRDNGPGIPDDKREKIFLPNFTTKSGGTGLGLAMVRNIVTGFGGDIHLVQSDETGTVFQIVFSLWSESES
ncbi:MAG: GHKL domain-containing protein [Bacteroidales bacterium]|nr:GHKL domain-containing protein [Bacteroidales bacterium]